MDAPNRSTVTKTEPLGDLPRWDLSDLYPGLTSPELERDLSGAEARAVALAEAFRGRVAACDGAALAEAVATYEAIQETLGRVGSFAQLAYSGNLSDPETARHHQTIHERITEISSHTLFLTLELNRVDDDSLAAKLAHPDLVRYRPWIRDVRAFRAHQLADDLERLLHEKQVVGRAAWIRLFDETMAALRFPVDGAELTVSEVLNRLTSPEPEARRAAAESLAQVLAENARVFALVTNTLAKDKEIEDTWRGFARPVSARNLANFVEDEVVDALIGAVQRAFPRLSHRYYRLKARWMGVERLAYWDRNAPLPEDDDRLIPWDEARATVLGAYEAFSDEMGAIGRRFFDNAWIDAPLRPGKAPGAFAHPTVPSAHPYLLLNYQGRVRDVMTLAHELGHGVHQVLAGTQGHLMSATPLTLAETASVFGEMLTFQALLDRETDPARRRIMLAAKVEDMLNTLVRQIALFEFERRVHDARRGGELTADRLGEIWLDTQREALGPAIRLDDGYRAYWAYIPHFVHAPFYVYAYAFGDCLVNALYARYREVGEGFARTYLDMLRAGGTKRHRELLAPFGLDASQPDFWDRGLGVIEGFIDQLETME